MGWEVDVNPQIIRQARGICEQVRVDKKWTDGKNHFWEWADPVDITDTEMGNLVGCGISLKKNVFNGRCVLQSCDYCPKGEEMVRRMRDVRNFVES